MNLWNDFLDHILWAPEGTEGGAGEGDAPVTESSDGKATSPPAGETATEGAAGEGGAASAVTAPAETPASGEAGEAQKPDWRDRRIAQLTARLRAEEAKGRGNGAPTLPPATGTQQPEGQDTNAEIERLANLRAADIAARVDFNRRCDDTAKAGRTEFGELQFNSRINGLMQLVDRQDPSSVATYNQFLEAAMESGSGAKIIHDLGGDLNRASEILSLPPVKMAMELARMAGAEARKESTAPKPITPVGSRSKNEVIDPRDTERADHLDTKSWMERRQKQVNEGRGR